MYKQLDLFAASEQPEPVLKPSGDHIAVADTEAEAIDVLTVLEEPEEIIAEEKPVILVAASAKKDIAVIQKKGKRGRKSLKEMDAETEMIDVPQDEILFKKQYYSIGEVATMFHLNASLLRYWETEFDILKPRKNRKGDRHFRPEDIKNLQLIHHLLRQRKYTIEGAKEYLKKNKSKARQNFELIQRLEKLKSFLLQLKAGL
jgi:DNA-binding transcriptional MerR regulator